MKERKGGKRKNSKCEVSAGQDQNLSLSLSLSQNQSQDDQTPRYEILASLADNVYVARIHIDDLVEQSLNARVMPRDMFRQLASNIGDRAAMVESLPYCVETDKGVEIVSGHHRVRAARQAGIFQIFILLDKNPMSRSKIISKQLSHNSIEGKDDPQIVKELFLQIQEAEAQIQAFIDPQALKIPMPPSINITDMLTDVQFRHISFFFLDPQLDKFDEVTQLIAADTALIGAVEMVHFEKFKTAVQKTREIDDIRAVGMILSRMCDIVLAYYKPIEAQLEEERKAAPSQTLDTIIGEEQ